MPIARCRKLPDLHRRAEQPSQRFAARVLEHQNGPAVLAHELQRPRRPGAVELVRQPVVIGKAIDDHGQRALGSREHEQNGALFAIWFRSPS